MKFWTKSSFSRQCLIIIVSLFSILLSIVILFQAWHDQKVVEDQIQRNVESLFSFTAHVLAVNPELFGSDGLQDIIRRFSKTVGGYERISIVDQSLTIIADSDREKLGRISDFEGLASVFEAGLDRHAHDVSGLLDHAADRNGYHEDSRAILGAYDPVRKSNVIGVMTVSYRKAATLFSPTPRLLWFMFLVSASVIVCGLIVWVSLWRLFVRPMEQLRVGVLQFSAGNLSYRIASDIEGEIGDVASNINEMAGNLEFERREREDAQRNIQNNELLLRSIIDQTPALISLKDLQGRYLLVNKGLEIIMGLNREEIVGKTTHDLGLEKAVVQSIIIQDRKVFETGTVQFQERQFDTVSGSYYRNGVKFPVFDQNGAINGVGTVSVDIAQREEMEEQLLQGQKMEVVGQLTGGVAHDFNNLLGVIVGNLDFLDEMPGNNAEQKEMIGTALQAALQGAELTSRLLAFSRKQALRPEVTSLNDLINGMTDLLKRTLGETILVRSIVSADLNLVEIDPGQFETALLNLSVNARHAMPEGGKLTIETNNVELDREYADKHAEVEPGAYVMLAVSDTGTGMPKEVLERAFDPFFTTKEVGEGSGLGLSMVHGFVKQSGGHISIYSEEGEGTTVKLYFPSSEAELAPTNETAESEAALRGAGETVLIVEDDESLRQLAIKIVSRLGYKVEAASDGPSALTMLDQGVSADVLFTDVVLPGGMNGVALAAAAKERRPGLRVLYTSGYTENAIVHNGAIDEGIELLDKPYRQRDVAERLRQILDC